MLGGGTPKNFINQASVQAEFYDDRVGGHRFAVQIVTDVPHFGGASGASLEEAQSWGKLATDAEQVTVHADVTIALPILVIALAGSAGETLASPEAAALRSLGTGHGRRRTAVPACALRGTRTMSFPFEYDHGAPLVVRRRAPPSVDRSTSHAPSSCPCRVDRTTSYVGGTRNGPREILAGVVAHGVVGRGTRDRRPRRRDLHAAGDGAARSASCRR